MRRSLLPFSFVVLAWPLSALAQSHPECVSVEGVARWGANAYNHIVVVENRCERAVACSVRTNVNPEPQQVRLAAGDRAELVTFLGSPAREFTPIVSCTYD